MIFEGYSCILDCETGGFLPTQNLLTEIGFIILDPDLEEVERFVTLIKPYDEKLYISKEAENLTGISLSKCINEGRPARDVVDEINAKWKSYKRKYQKITLVGHNFKFDLNFLEYFWSFINGTTKYGKSSLYEFVDEQTECTMRLAHKKWGRSNELSDFKLNTIANHIGIENTASHSALGDVEVTAEIYRYLISCLKGDGNFKSKNAKTLEFQF